MKIIINRKEYMSTEFIFGQPVTADGLEGFIANPFMNKKEKTIEVCSS